jgi:hypothetical protein
MRWIPDSMMSPVSQDMVTLSLVLQIADLRFYRSPEYISYFDYLDRSGGFFCALPLNPPDVNEMNLCRS